MQATKEESQLVRRLCDTLQKESFRKWQISIGSSWIPLDEGVRRQIFPHTPNEPGQDLAGYKYSEGPLLFKLGDLRVYLSHDFKRFTEEASEDTYIIRVENNESKRIICEFLDGDCFKDIYKKVSIRAREYFEKQKRRDLQYFERVLKNRG